MSWQAWFILIGGAYFILSLLWVIRAWPEPARRRNAIAMSLLAGPLVAASLLAIFSVVVWSPH